SGSLRLLVIASDLPDVLNLPWELILPPEGDFLGVDSKFSIRRFPRSDQQLEAFDGDLRPRPLRLLLAASSPTNLPTLDYEREEEYLLRAISGLDVAFDSGDLGSFEDLRNHVEQFQPQVVHLTGHGAVGKKCPSCEWLNDPDETVCEKCSASLEDVSALGHFAFEGETGKADPRSSEELSRMMALSGVQCVFVSGCETGKAPSIEALGGVCQGLVSEEVPLAIGWAASIADNVANQFARSFYRTLAAGRSVDRALVQARQTVWETCEKKGDPSWTLPVLYSATDQGQIFDPDPRRPKVEPPRDIGPQRPLPGMIEGYAEQFIGRRREQQRLLTALRDGSLQTVIITGLGGSGKSALATRIAWKLKGDGFEPIAVPSSKENPLRTDSLIQIFGDAFLAANLDDAFQKLNNPQIPADARLRYAIGILNKSRFLLVLDNFESNMDEASRLISDRDRDLAEFYGQLLANLTGGSRALVTSRYLPADLPTLPPKIKEEPLGDFGEASFFKFLRRDDLVEKRLRSGELSHELMRKVHRLFGGTPRFLDQIRKVMREIPADDLKKQLEAVKVPTGLEKGELQKILDEYCEEIFTSRLYGYLSPESQRALSLAAVYGVAVNLEGLAAVTGEPSEKLQGFAREWQDRAFAYRETERAATELWAVYGLLRGWLLAQLGSEDRKAAYKAAGDFLSDLVQQDQSKVLGLSPVEVDLEARYQYLQAEDYEQAREVTARVSVFFTRSGLYDGVRRLNVELLRYEEHPSTMSWVGKSFLDQGNYSEAEDWYSRSLDVAGDVMPDEVVLALHQLATIDLNRGEYEEARQKFETALKMRQQIGDRAGEAQNFAQLGIMASERDRAEEGLGLVTLSATILGSIGHADLKKVEPWVNQLASKLNYTQEQFDAMIQEVKESYDRDRGWGLIEAAFADPAPEPDKV
ncbi:MAG TPA: CHAT domain-containing protein, partial [Methanotrichaceae archaeon]|nr:CHAT domain-containing protein [Methanotrichaceae archaeon]